MRSFNRIRLASLSGLAGPSTAADPVQAVRGSVATPVCLLLVAVMAAGCMLSPRYGLIVPSTSTPILVSGTTPVAGQKVTITGGCGKTTTFATKTGYEPVATDVAGVKWYAYSKTVVVPSQLWCPGDGSYFTYVNAYSDGHRHYSFYGEDRGVPLEECADASMSGVQILMECAVVEGAIVYSTGR